jgi:hypothetical protein
MTIKVVNMIPASLSGESHQDSEPNVAVNPENTKAIVGTAFTPAPTGGSFAPIYVSSDGGNTWALRTVVPGNGFVGTSDITVSFAGSGGHLYAGTLNGTTIDFQILRTPNYLSVSPMTVLLTRANEDQPWVVATTTKVKNLSRDRVYIGNNDFNTSPKTATVDLSLNAATAAAPAGFGPHQVEHGPASPQDGPPTRIAVHPDGTVYAVFERWTSSTGAGNVTLDVVITRDDNWGSGATPFQALGVNGNVIAPKRFVRWNAIMGQERLGGDLCIAVDPNHSGTVWVAWCDRVGGAGGTDWTVHVRRSTDHGVTWSNDLRTITNVKNPSLAINSNSELGLLYQAFTGSRWVTKLELTFNGWSTAATTIVLHSAPSATPLRQFFPYLGDYVRMIAVGTSFYGVFCGNNTPDMANFPSGVTYQRGANWATKTLLSTDGVTVVAPSIDPFFFEWSPSVTPIVGVVPPHVAVLPITREPVLTKPQPISVIDPPPPLAPPVTRQTRRRSGGKGSTIDL